MFTVIDNKVYLIENSKIFPVNVSIENGVEKVGQAKDLPKGYQVYTLNEILVKFNIKAKDEEQKKADEKAKLEAEIRAKIEEENKAKDQNNK